MAITKRQYENKAITAAPATKAQPVGMLMAGHGRLVCGRCNRVLAACPHIGHQALSTSVYPDCDGCRDGG